MTSNAEKTGEPGPDGAAGLRRLEGLSLLLLFALGLGLRWLMADGDFFGDEAWYFYLARSFGRESAAQAEHPLFHLANRPLFYAFFHASTYGGLWSFRLAGCCVGACLPPLAFCCARALGASRLAAAVAALCLCVQPLQLQYSANVFPDVLAACFALCACWAAARGSAPWTLVFSLACVWSKESFVVLPAIATGLRLHGSGRLKRPDLWAWLTCGLPVAYLALVTTVSLTTAGVRLQGWSKSPFGLGDAHSMFVGPEVWPWLLWLAWWRQTRVLVLWLGLPLFYLAWSGILGRGMEAWYALGPMSLSLVAAALGFDALHRRLRGRIARPVQALLLGAALLSIAPIPLGGMHSLRERIAALGGRWPRPSPAPDVVAILKALQPKRVLVVDCFWAYRYSHLRGRTAPGTGVWWASSADNERILQHARKADIIVIWREPGHEEIQTALRQLASAPLLETKDWLVLRRLHPRGVPAPLAASRDATDRERASSAGLRR